MPLPNIPNRVLPHHRDTLDRAAAHFRANVAVRAVVLGGSIAKGVEKPTSDVDVMVIVTAEEFERRRRVCSYAEVIRELAEYEGGYVDVKYMDESFLISAAERGSEPTRDSFAGTQTVWSEIVVLDELLSRIPRYPEHERDDKIRRFYSSALVQLFFLSEGEKRGDPFLLAHASTQMALHAGRLILAHNRILFPSNKRLMERVASATERPEGFADAVSTLLNAPSREAGQSLIDSINAFQNWGIDWGTALGQYVEDGEFNWLIHTAPLAES